MATPKKTPPIAKTHSRSKDIPGSRTPRNWQFLVGYPPEDLKGKGINGKNINILPDTYATNVVENFQRGKGMSEVDALVLRESIFAEINQPLLDLQVFVHAAKIGIYPSLLVMGYLASGIGEYLEAEGTKRLDECLGLVGKPGMENHFSQWKKLARNIEYIKKMVLLRKTFNMTIEDAAYLVSQLPGSLKQETLENSFKKNKFWKLYRKFMEPAEWLQLKTSEDRKNFIKYFPLDSLPERLKSLHPDYPI